MSGTHPESRPGDHVLETPAPADRGETYFVVGIEGRRGRASRAILARDASWGLEYAGSAELELPDDQARPFWLEVDRLRSDYPHIKAPIRNARWLKPLMTVELISRQKCRPTRAE